MHKLGFSLCLASLAAVSANAAQPASDSAFASLLSRQAPGTPQYACHENCGNTIALGRTPNHCDNADWVSAYEACLECALEFDIWTIYGSGVTRAAEPCGLTPTPVSPSESSTPTPTTDTASTSESGTPTVVTEPVATTDTPSTGEVTTDPVTTTPPPTETGATVPTTTAPPTTAGATGSDVHAAVPLLTVGMLGAIFVGLLGAW